MSVEAFYYEILLLILRVPMHLRYKFRMWIIEGLEVDYTNLGAFELLYICGIYGKVDTKEYFKTIEFPQLSQ